MSLEQIGPPPYTQSEFRGLPVLFDWLGAYAPESDRAVLSSLVPALLTAPDYSLRDICYRNLGFVLVPTPKLYDSMLPTDLAGPGADFRIPILFQGTDDDITLAPLARESFDFIQSPRKECVDFRSGGHCVVWSMRDRVLHERVTRVRPLAMMP